MTGGLPLEDEEGGNYHSARGRYHSMTGGLPLDEGGGNCRSMRGRYHRMTSGLPLDEGGGITG